LAIEGVQPAIPQNPTPSGKEAKDKFISLLDLTNTLRRCQSRVIIKTRQKPRYFQWHYF
jgi:hypothetical protein